MKKHLFGWASVLISALTVVPMAMGATPADASPVHNFSTCRAIKEALPAARDGNYLLYNGGNLFTAYCYDMATTPSEYIDLAETTGANYSQYTAGGASPGTDVRTRFTKLRINPATLAVDIGDLTFASSTGQLKHAGTTTVTSMPYGVAMSCVAPGDNSGVGNIDLQNTPFQVDSTFALGGSQPAGSASVSPDDQVVDLRGGGYCGWVTPAPALYNPFNPNPGMYHFMLRCATNPVASVPGQVCVRVGKAMDITEQMHSGQGMTVLYRGHQIAVVNSDDQVRS
jgi:hypothetical protein